MNKFTFIKLSFVCLVLSIIFIPKDTYAFNIQAYWATDGWSVIAQCEDSQCQTSTGAYIQNPSYHCPQILGIQFNGNYQANHTYHNELRITIPSSNSIAPWQNLTNQDLGWYPNYNQVRNFTRTTLSPASPANPQYYPQNWFDRTYDLSYDISNNSNFTSYGLYFYFNSSNCQNIGGIRIQSYTTTDLDGPTDDNQSIIQNQNKNTSDIINNQNQNQQQTNEKLDAIGDDLTDINDALTDENVDSSSNHFDDEFGGGSWGPPPQNTSPLATIVNLPLQYLRTITSNTTCSNLNLTIPYMNTNISIPCITSYLSTNFSSGVVNLVQLIVNALVLYKVGVSFWDFLHNLRDPHSDDLEVVDL